jgi:hypothetical protein
LTRRIKSAPQPVAGDLLGLQRLGRAGRRLCGFRDRITNVAAHRIMDSAVEEVLIDVINIIELGLIELGHHNRSSWEHRNACIANDGCEPRYGDGRGPIAVRISNPHRQDEKITFQLPTTLLTMGRLTDIQLGFILGAQLVGN